MNRAGLEDVNIHTMRHTFASRMVQHGMTIHEVSSLLGHSDITTTMRYAHLDHAATSSKATDILNNMRTVPVSLPSCRPR